MIATQVSAHIVDPATSHTIASRRLDVTASFRVEPWRFVVKLAFLAAALGVCVAVVVNASSWPVRLPFQVAIGLLIAHATELVHQCLHKTAIGIARWDHRFGRLLAWMSGTSFWYYCWFHLWHHRYNGTELDAESFGYEYGSLQAPHRATRIVGLVRHLSMGSHYRSMFRRVTLALRGLLVGELIRSTPEMKPVIARRIVHDYLGLAVILGAAVVASVAFHTRIIVDAWLIPMLLAWGPAHALIELPEHWACDRPEANTLRNTRTIRAGRFARWFTNNNCNHIGHHHDMSVPMERLPEYEAELMCRGVFQHYDQSYPAFYRAFLGDIFVGSSAPASPRSSVDNRA